MRNKPKMITRKQGKLVEITEEELRDTYEYRIYGVLDEESGHYLGHHRNCDINFCAICEGGLSHCIVCGGLEGTLTTNCCGRQLTKEEEEQIYGERSLDFRYGIWMQGVTSEYLFQSGNEMRLNIKNVRHALVKEKCVSIGDIKHFKEYVRERNDIINKVR